MPHRRPTLVRRRDAGTGTEPIELRVRARDPRRAFTDHWRLRWVRSTREDGRAAGKKLTLMREKVQFAAPPLVRDYSSSNAGIPLGFDQSQ